MAITDFDKISTGGGGGGVTGVTATAPITSTGGATPDIGITSATPLTDGSMSASDKNKLNGIAPGAQPGTVTSVVGTAPISVVASPTAPSVGITQSGVGTDGYLSSVDWNTFNNKGDGVVTTLTTIGSGAATLVGDTLNIPTPTGTGDMLAATYDPTGVAADVYDYANALGITQITDDIITAPTLTGNVDNWNPTGFADANMIRVDVDANNREITGMIAPSAGVNRIVRINNLNSGSFDLKFKENDASSDAANRFLLRDNGDKAIKPNETAAFWYDHTSLRWRPLNRIG